ncbi:MAG TPA: adenylate/guanylate cyclase domain-containing protein, partial [Candidatus Cloacimonadota bacterium]|nr:adenylate/guanylate cyclase domain-containing protein [Candidatus Cloacimonadota bacterium]
IISEATYEKVKDYVEARYLDEVKVKGKNISVKIYELLDIKDQV